MLKDRYTLLTRLTGFRNYFIGSNISRDCDFIGSMALDTKSNLNTYEWKGIERLEANCAL